MKFVQIENRKGMINLDGYSDRKTLRGALRDLAREVAKIDKSEADSITCYLDETVEMVKGGMVNESGAYYLEAQEVESACKWNEDTDEMEYADGHWYLYIRFAAC
jgi:hypothetical protein